MKKNAKCMNDFLPYFRALLNRILGLLLHSFPYSTLPFQEMQRMNNFVLSIQVDVKDCAFVVFVQLA